MEGQIQEFVILVSDKPDETTLDGRGPDTPAPTSVTAVTDATPTAGLASQNITRNAAKGGEDLDGARSAGEKAGNSYGTRSAHEKSRDSDNDKAVNLEFMELRYDEKKPHLAEYRKQPLIMARCF